MILVLDRVVQDVHLEIEVERVQMESLKTGRQHHHKEEIGRATTHHLQSAHMSTMDRVNTPYLPMRILQIDSLRQCVCCVAHTVRRTDVKEIGIGSMR